MLCGPETVCDDCDTPFNFNYALHAWNRFGFLRIEALEFSAKDRGPSDHGDNHPRHIHIQSKNGFAICLFRRVEASRWFADELELLWVFQRRILWGREARRFFGQFAITQLPSRAAVNDSIVFRATGV